MSKRTIEKSKKEKNLKWSSERIVIGKTPENILRLHLDRYKFAKEFISDLTVLDIASGTGYGTRLLSASAKQIFGGDISRDAIAFGQSSWRRSNLSYFITDARVLPFGDKTFDAVISFETVEHLPKNSMFISECRRVLKDNGIFICSTCNKNILTAGWKRPLNPFHIEELTENDFLKLLKSQFGEVRLYGQLFLNHSERLKYMLYYTIGFCLVRLKLFSVFQSFVKPFARMINPDSLDCDYYPEKISLNLRSTPGYLIAVCMRNKV